MSKECYFAEYTDLESCMPPVPGFGELGEELCCLCVARKLPSLLLIAVIAKYMKTPSFENITDSKYYISQDPRISRLVEELRNRGGIVSEIDDGYPVDRDELFKGLFFDIRSLCNQSPK